MRACLLHMYSRVHTGSCGLFKRRHTNGSAVQDKSESKITADSGGKQINRNGEPGNPAYVLAMDKGDSKDGKEVAKKGSNLHSRENGGSGEEGALRPPPPAVRMHDHT